MIARDLSEPVWFRRSGRVAAGAMAAAWVVILVLILRHRIFTSSDTVSNYAHVWYVSKILVASHRIPFHMPVIGHGRGLAFPYGFIPWLFAAVLRPWLGDWAVTLALVIGSIGAVLATFTAFPELRRSWWIALVLANPVLIGAVLLGQLPFVWAIAMFLGAVACWRTGSTGWAIVLAGLGQATHVAVVLPIAAIVVAGWLRWESDRRRLLCAYAASLVIALPAVPLVFMTPAYTDSALGVKVANLIGTVAPRLLVVVIPVLLVLISRVSRPWMPPILLVVLIAITAALATQADNRHAWGDLEKSPERTLLPYLASSAFRPGLEYRVLSTTDRRIGMYQVIQHGGTLDSEFFPESLVRRTWPDALQYCRFLKAREVDRVIVYDEYDLRLRKNEQKLLSLLSLHDRDGCTAAGVAVRLVTKEKLFEVYAITR